MTGRIFTADHHVYDLPPLLSWNVRHTGTVPCDNWSVTAVYQPEMLTVLRMAAGFAAIENGMTQLRGIVDEYTVELGSRGMTVTLSGRGYAARLLDNESRPVTYEQVTLRELIRCHAEPYGISCGAAADLRSTVPYTAGVGISQWKVISEFCRTYGGFLPRFAKTGELLATPEQDSGKRIILDSGSPVLNCRIREDHYGVLTEALVIDKRQNVSYSVKNPEMSAKGGQCRRVIYTPGRSTWDAMRYTGEYQIQQSKKEEQAVPTADADQGVSTIVGDQMGVVTRGEVRQLPIYGPGGYVWLPESGASVLVIKGGPGGEEQCVCGGKQAEVPKGMQPGEVYIYGPKGSNVYLQKDGTIELTGRISIRGQLLVNGELYKPCTCGGGL